MSTIKEKLDAEIKSAMLSKDTVKKELLKVVKSEISREEGGLKTYGDKEIIGLMRKMVKNLETIQSDQSKAEIAILSEYIPSQMSEEQVKEIVGTLITETGATSAKEMGKIMGAFKAKYDGQADNNLVSKVTKELLTA